MKTIRPKIELLRLGTVDKGKQLEVNAQFDGLSQSLATIVADDTDESLWFEVYVGDKAVQIPLDLIKDAISAAPNEVHSESWYEKNVYSDDDAQTQNQQAEQDGSRRRL